MPVEFEVAGQAVLSSVVDILQAYSKFWWKNTQLHCEDVAIIDWMYLVFIQEIEANAIYVEPLFFNLTFLS